MKKSPKFKTVEELLAAIEGDLIRCKDIESYVEDKRVGETYKFFLYLVSEDITKTIKRDLKHFDPKTQESLRSFLRDYRNTVNYVSKLERFSLSAVKALFDVLLNRIEILRENHNTFNIVTEERMVA